MKRMITRKEKREFFLMLSSFLMGSIITLLLMRLTQGNGLINKTKVYEKNSLAASVDKVKDAVVHIETYSGTIALSNGSGFIYKVNNKKAYILTNEHVIDGNIIKITTSNDEVIEGKLLGKDAYIDLAVVEIDKKYAKQVAILGDSTKSNVGDTVFAVGSPVSNRYLGSVTSGILSGKDRVVQTMIEGTNSSEWLMKVLQFDASINPGNSGGPVLNAKGEVIGVVTMKLIKEDIEGMAFAVPMEDALKYIEDLEKGKEIEWPAIGITMTNATNTSELARIGMEDLDLENGAVVLSVEKGSGADGVLKKKDIITEIDGLKVKDISYVKYAIFQHKVGEKIKLKITRDGKEKEVTITIKKSTK